MTMPLTLRAEDQAPPEWLRILPLGRVELVDRRDPLEVDEDSLKNMVAAFTSRGVDLVIDYEHQSLNGDRAPAAGWIKHLEARADGLWARVEWTAQARDYLANREYRYFSPVLRLDPESRKPAALMHLGLTNVPAIKSLPPLVAKAGGGDWQEEPRESGTREIMAEAEEVGMLEALKDLVGLKPEAGDAEVGGRVLTVFRELGAALDLEGEASPGRLQDAVAALKAGARRLAETQAELEALKERLARETAERVVTEALKAGKVTPAQKSWALEYYRRDPEGFQAYVAGAPRVVPTGEVFELLAEGREGSLLPEELALCRSLNLSPDRYLQAKALAVGSGQWSEAGRSWP
jgi:phage I-like protein